MRVNLSRGDSQGSRPVPGGARLRIFPPVRRRSRGCAGLRRLRIVGTVGQGRPGLVHALACICARWREPRHTTPLPSTILKVRHTLGVVARSGVTRSRKAGRAHAASLGPSCLQGGTYTKVMVAALNPTTSPSPVWDDPMPLSGA